MIVAMMFVAAGMFAGSASAAGQNGQQILLCNPPSNGYAVAMGTNQNGQWSEYWWKPVTGGCDYNNRIDGWWWKGTVTVHFYDWNYSYINTRYCYTFSSAVQDTLFCH